MYIFVRAALEMLFLFISNEFTSVFRCGL